MTQFDSPHVAQPHVQSRLYEAGCELEQLSNLFAAIAEHLDGPYDFERAGATAASLARLGCDGIDVTLQKLLGAENKCATCWKSRLAIAEVLGGGATTEV